MSTTQLSFIAKNRSTNGGVTCKIKLLGEFHLVILYVF